MSTIVAASASYADITAAIEQAVDGDVVEVPPGNVTWEAALNFLNKQITLKGAGIDQTIAARNVSGSFVSLSSQTKPFRISGFTFDFTLATKFTIRCKGWRIDHCKFDSPVNNTLIEPTGQASFGHPDGLIDNCILLNTRILVFGAPHTSNFNVPKRHWADPTNLGTDEAVYIEDCFFRKNGGNVVDANHGAKFVVRHCVIEDAYLECHSIQAVQRGTRKWEIYNNVFRRNDRTQWDPPELNPGFLFRPIFFRAGTGVIFGNRIAADSLDYPNGNFMDFDIVRSTQCPGGPRLCLAEGHSLWDSNEAIETGSHTGAESSTNLVDSTKNWDVDQWSTQLTPRWVWNLETNVRWKIVSNTADTLTLEAPDMVINDHGERLTFELGDTYKICGGYLARDQVGAGQDDFLWGNDNWTNIPPQAKEPVYLWNNVKQDGVTAWEARVTSGEISRFVIQENRDYIYAEKPGYTPLAYPHPLRGEEGTIPTFYIDFETGSDPNPGTKDSPWKRHPFMHGWTGGTYNHVPGTRFIFKGNITWPNECLGLHIDVGGEPGNPDYYGVDFSWFTGPEFTRPIFDGQNLRLPQTKNNRENMIYVNGASNIVFDNLIFRRWQWNDPIPTSLIDGFAIRSTNDNNNINATRCTAENWKVNVPVDGRFGGFNGLTRAIDCEVFAPTNIDPQFVDAPNGHTSGCGFFACDLVDGCKVVGVSQGMFSCRVVRHCHLLDCCNSFRQDTKETGAWVQNNAVMYSSIIENFQEGVLAHLLPYWTGEGLRRTLFFNNIVFDINRDALGSTHNPVVASNHKAPPGNNGEIYVFNNLIVRGGVGGIWYGTEKEGALLQRAIIANNILVTPGSGIFSNGPLAHELIITNNLPITAADAAAAGMTKENLFHPSTYSGEVVALIKGKGVNVAAMMTLVEMRAIFNTERWQGLGSFQVERDFDGFIRFVGTPDEPVAWDIGPYDLVAAGATDPIPPPEEPEPPPPPPPPPPDDPPEPIPEPPFQDPPPPDPDPDDPDAPDQPEPEEPDEPEPEPEPFPPGTGTIPSADPVHEPTFGPLPGDEPGTGVLPGVATGPECPEKPALCEEVTFANLSSEGPDGPLFIARFRSDTFFGAPIGPPTQATNPEDCISLVSQEDADLCARRTSEETTHPVHFPPLVYNNPASCTRFCKDGLPFTYFLPPGVVSGNTQQEADANANSLACTLASRHIICLSDIPIQPCLNVPYDEIITITSYYPVKVQVAAGSLPEGLKWERNDDGNIRIFGTPTAEEEEEEEEGTPTEAEETEITFYVENIFGDFMYKPFLFVVGEEALYEPFRFFGVEALDATEDPPEVVIAFPAQGYDTGWAPIIPGECGGVIQARVSRHFHDEPQAAFLQQWRRVSSEIIDVFQPVLVRIQGTARNGHILNVSPLGEPGVRIFRPNFVGEIDINVALTIQPSPITGITPFLNIWWGVIAQEGQSQAFIKLTYNIGRP